MKKLVLVCALALIKISAVNAEALTAAVDNTTVPLGEVFNLNLSFDGKNGSSMQPDLSVLQKDFSIYSTSSSSQISYINGKSSEQTDWDIGLMPKYEGELEIPAVSIGSYSSKPLKIKVLPAWSNISVSAKKNGNIQNDNQLAEANKFSVDLAVSAQKTYVQQEINAVLTLKDKVGLQLTEEPKFVNAEDWIVKTLKKPEITQQNGERVVKFYYALFPQKSGPQEIPAVKVNGFYMGFDKAKNHPLLHQGVNSLFQLMNVDFDEMFGTQKPVELYTKPVKIDVLPAGENGWWLPAEVVKVKAFWNEKKPLFKVGETVSRQIAVLAVGVAETQLPELDFADNESFKIYPENPELEAKIYDDKVVAQSINRVVYIPQKGGEQVLPEIKINWFNVKTGKAETAVIPAEKVFVEGGAAVDNLQNEQNINADKQEQNISRQQAEKSESQPAEKNEFSKENVLALVIGAFILGALCSLLLRRRSEKICEKEVKSHNAASVLHKNFADKDYRALRDNLVLWGQQNYKTQNVNNLEDVAKAVSEPKFDEQLQKLNNILYGGKEEHIDEKVILQTIKQAESVQKQKSETELLPKLYK